MVMFDGKNHNLFGILFKIFDNYKVMNFKTKYNFLCQDLFNKKSPDLTLGIEIYIKKLGSRLISLVPRAFYYIFLFFLLLALPSLMLIQDLSPNHSEREARNRLCSRLKKRQVIICFLIFSRTRN